MTINLGPIKGARFVSSLDQRRSAKRRISMFLTRSEAPDAAVAANISLDQSVKTRGRQAPNTCEYKTPLGGYWKRGLDIAIASSMLLILAPVMLMTAALIYLTMGRPIFYADERIGFNRTAFRCYKFRTMVKNAKDKLTAYLENNPEAAAEWRLTQKLKDDPRITPLGKLLRKSSLDELPQLMNALRGDMTCVGPRPVTVGELARYGASARYYIRTRPGLTGLWQVSGRSNTSYRYRVVLDRSYVTSWSVWSDISILLRTAPALLRFRDSA